jgi:hypothetical protein
MTAEILRHLRQYFAKEVSRREFEEWFVPAAWNLKAADNPSTVGLSEQIYLALAEADNAHLDENELRERLTGLEAEAATSDSISSPGRPEIRH